MNEDSALEKADYLAYDSDSRMEKLEEPVPAYLSRPNSNLWSFGLRLKAGMNAEKAFGENSVCWEEALLPIVAIAPSYLSSSCSFVASIR
ncbi:hypothetical protein M9H77_28524 [Catharanthus roseus]|uniref:Uncharacterized protein n=1 Tax=Catharanthus roseus TaxID=4058 RepID=A0ACC0AJQ1_CATRO|nr:hypothetical protein M9H77_28524 [Catharanthus roseus]